MSRLVISLTLATGGGTAIYFMTYESVKDLAPARGVAQGSQINPHGLTHLRLPSYAGGSLLRPPCQRGQRQKRINGGAEVSLTSGITPTTESWLMMTLCRSRRLEPPLPALLKFRDDEEEDQRHSHRRGQPVRTCFQLSCFDN